jgi:hypothetical protein
MDQLRPAGRRKFDQVPALKLAPVPQADMSLCENQFVAESKLLPAKVLEKQQCTSPASATPTAADSAAPPKTQSFRRLKSENLYFHSISDGSA